LSTTGALVSPSTWQAAESYAWWKTQFAWLVALGLAALQEYRNIQHQKKDRTIKANS
jgi:hypothetical protein